MNHRLNSSRSSRVVFLSLFLVLAGLLRPAQPATAATSFEDRMLELVNRARAAAGAAPVQPATGLAAIAGSAPYDGCGYRVSGRTADMGARNYFSHTILQCGGRGFTSMLQAAGIVYDRSAENIAWVGGITDPLAAAERLHNDLMASSAHRTNILDPAVTHIGLGSWHTAAGELWSGAGTPMR